MNTATKGYYSLIQYCPDRSRMESANVGVVLFCPDIAFLDARLASGNDRLRRFFKSGSFDPVAIHAAKRAIASRFKADRSAFGTIEELEHFIATRANTLSMTPARPMKVFAPAEDLGALFRDLVGGRTRSDRESEPKRALDKVFHRPEFEGRVEFNRVVRVPIIGKDFRAPYAYRNGVLNLIKPQDFPANEGSATATAMKLAIEGDLLWRRGQDIQERARLIVVPSFATQPDDDDDIENRVIDLFRNYEVKTVRLDQIDEFAAQISREAH